MVQSFAPVDWKRNLCWLLKNEFPFKDCIIYYGFDANERTRIQRRSGILGAMGYKSDYPIALWPESERTISQTIQIGINPPAQYENFKHANCIDA